MTSLRIDRLNLVGAGREIRFRRGLSIVHGQIATGKTTLLRLLGGLFGNMPGRLPPEFNLIEVLRGEIQIGQESWVVARPRTSTATAKVDITGAELLRLPASVNDGSAGITYEQWLMKQMGLPEIRVPNRRSDPAFDGTSKLSINDWLNYCLIPGPEIDTMIFGNKRMGVSEKRKWIFEVNYGYYDEGAAFLHGELQEVQRLLQALRQQDAALKVFVEGTVLQDPDAVRADLVSAKDLLAQLDSMGRSLVSEAIGSDPQTAALRAAVLDGRTRLAEITDEVQALGRQVANLVDLEKQLVSQSRRLTRAIVSQDRLLDVDFVVCPRCGQDLHHEHRLVPDTSCVLCLQPLDSSTLDNRTVLISEQDRLEAQIRETADVRVEREAEIVDAERNRSAAVEHVRELAEELDRRTASFISDRARQLESLAERRATAVGDVKRLQELVGLLERRNQMVQLAQEAEARKAAIEQQLDEYDLDLHASRERVHLLEERMLEYLRYLDPPSVGSELSVSIDTKTYMPVVSGRAFESLSSQGLCVLVNIAHALAHHTVSIDLDLPLPGFLALDGISSNTGREGWDAEREENAFRLIARVAEEYVGRLQLIVLDNNTPAWLSNSIVLELTQEDRLIRTA
jgi:hypothetical protein